MQVERGINPNCSELVIRLDIKDVDLVKEELKSIGIDEVLVKNFYDFQKDTEEWDDDSNNTIISLEDIDPEAMKIYERLRYKSDKMEEEEYKRLKKELKDKYNIDDWSDIIMLRDIENNLPDLVNKGAISIGRDRDYDDRFENIAIWAHQHCQHQLFPTLRKISRHFDANIMGFDGGSSEEFEYWCEHSRSMYENEQEAENE